MTDENVASFPPPKPTVPVYRVVERIVNQTLDAVEARETPELQSFVKAVADGGPSMKRVSPRAMGRAYFIKHRTSHLTIELSDETLVGRAAARGDKR